MLTQSIDLTSCDAEPIHMIGAIQPNGALIAVDQETLAVEFASANADIFFGRPCAELLGGPLAALLGAEQCAELSSRAVAPTMPDLLRPWFVAVARPDGAMVRLECYPHRYEKRIILEFVPLQDGPAVMWEEDLVRQRIISEDRKSVV